jgi:hypothetical protein
MLDRERRREALPHPFIHSLPLYPIEGVRVSLNCATGAISFEPPPLITDIAGGFYCDEPGLGKTVTSLALILKTAGLYPQAPRGAVVHAGAVPVITGGVRREVMGFEYFLPTGAISHFCGDCLFSGSEESVMQSEGPGSLSSRVKRRRAAAAVAAAAQPLTPEDERKLLEQVLHSSCQLTTGSSGLGNVVTSGSPGASHNTLSSPKRPSLPLADAADTGGRGQTLPSAAGLPVLESSAVAGPAVPVFKPPAHKIVTEGQMAPLPSHSSPMLSGIPLSSATLVIVPNTLIKHWAEQIGRHTASGALRVYAILDKATASMEPHALAWDFDVVLTTFSLLSALGGPHVAASPAKRSPAAAAAVAASGHHRVAYSHVLLRVHWFRVILDEGHLLGTSNITNRLRVICALRAERRWVLTGTPTPSSPGSPVTTLQPLLAFLGNEPYGCSVPSFEAAIKSPFEAGRPLGALAKT